MAKAMQFAFATANPWLLLLVNTLRELGGMVYTTIKKEKSQIWLISKPTTTLSTSMHKQIPKLSKESKRNKSLHIILH
jgi:hypothetical protein